MKKILGLLLVGGLSLSLVACSNQEQTTVQPTPSPTSDTTTESGMKMGLGSVSHISVADANAEQDGNVKVETTYAMLVLNEDGTIAKAEIDTVETIGKFNDQGVANVVEDVKTKGELKDEYPMKPASSIGKNWYEQVDALENYVVGKTIDEVLSMELDPNNGIPVDLKTECTIDVSDMIEAMNKAYENAEIFKDAMTYGLASNTSVTNTDASADKDGMIKVTTDMVAIALDENGNVADVHIDTLEASGSFSKDGIATPIAEDAMLLTKGELKENYPMKAASPIGKDWYEQVDALEDHMTNKAITDIISMQLENGKVADLSTSCTIDVTSMMQTVTKAVERAAA